MRRRKVSQKSGDALLNRDIAIVFFFFNLIILFHVERHV